MIHFDFTVTDVEAETIFDVMNLEVSKCHTRKLKSNITKQHSEWLDKHIEYLTTLKKKMLNERI